MKEGRLMYCQAGANGEKSYRGGIGANKHHI